MSKTLLQRTYSPQSSPTLAALMLAAFSACSGGPSGANLASNKVGDSNSALSSGSGGSLSAAAGPGMCLQPLNKSLDNGTPIVIAPCDGSLQQAWTFINGSLRLGDSQCLDVKDGNNSDGAHLQLWDCAANNTNQQWSENNGVFNWVNTNKCLDMSNGNASANNIMGIWTCNAPNKNQVWTMNSQNNGGATAGSSPVSAGTLTAAPQSNNFSGYVHTSGTNIVDGSGNNLRLRGVNIGGWLVTENWMDGMVDSSDNSSSSTDNSVGRFAKETLERRFGEDQAQSLLNIWYDRFFTTQDLDNIKGMGMNVIRVPFGYRNLQHADGSWMRDSSGNIDFSRLDWVVNEAGKRGIYTILDYHIWQGQRENYQMISQNSDAGRAQQAQAAALWTEVAKHFRGNTNIAAFDVINEPTGSYANMMQIALYNAVRQADGSRMIVMESMNADPAGLGWSNVVYTIHAYGMMGNDFGQNQSSFYNDLNGSINTFHGYNIPVYVGEFMCQGAGTFLSWVLGQYNTNNLAWTPWTYKAVNMGSWACYNLGGNVHVDLGNDSYSSIQNTWNNMGSGNPEWPIINALKGATGN